MTTAITILTILLIAAVITLLLTLVGNHILKDENQRLRGAVSILSNPSSSEQVHEFHTVYGAAIRTSPVADIPEAELRIKLIEEELDELKEAVANNDMVEIADALGDIRYVTEGAAHTWGFDLDSVTDEIHRSNLSKLGADGLPIISDGTDGYPLGKVLKGPNYSPPNIAAVLERTGGHIRPTRAAIADAALGARASL